MPSSSAAVSGSKTTGTSAVFTWRAPSRRSVRCGGDAPDLLGRLEVGQARARSCTSSRAPSGRRARPAARPRARRTKTGSRRGSRACSRARSGRRPGPTSAPCELTMPGVSSATASARRARSMRSSVGSSPGDGSNSARSTSSGGTISSGSPAAGSSPVARAMPTVSATSCFSAGQEKSEVCDDRRAPAHEDADAERLAAGLGQRLDLALADGDRELGALGDQHVGGVGARAAGRLQELLRELGEFHRWLRLQALGALRGDEAVVEDHQDRRDDTVARRPRTTSAARPGCPPST